MPSNYPAAFDTPADTHVDNVQEPVHAADINNMADAIKAIQQVLGLNPHQGNLPANQFATVVARLNALDVPTIKAVTPPYTCVIADLGQILNCGNAAAANVTIPPHSSVAFPVGTTLTFRAGAAGTITIVGGTGVTIQSRGGAVASAGQFAMIQALQTATDFWTLMGDVA